MATSTSQNYRKSHASAIYVRIQNIQIRNHPSPFHSILYILTFASSSFGYTSRLLLPKCRHIPARRTLRFSRSITAIREPTHSTPTSYGSSEPTSPMIRTTAPSNTKSYPRPQCSDDRPLCVPWPLLPSNFSQVSYLPPSFGMIRSAASPRLLQAFKLHLHRRSSTFKPSLHIQEAPLNLGEKLYQILSHYQKNL